MADCIELVESVRPWCTTCKRWVDTEGSWYSAHEAGVAHVCAPAPSTVNVAYAHTLVVRVPDDATEEAIAELGATLTGSGRNVILVSESIPLAVSPLDVGSVAAIVAKTIVTVLTAEVDDVQLDGEQLAELFTEAAVRIVALAAKAVE